MIDELSRFGQDGAHLNTDCKISFVGGIYCRNLGVSGYEYYFAVVIDGANVNFWEGCIMHGVPVK